MNGLKFLTVWFCSVVGKTYVFPITDIPEEDNALHEIQPTALTVLSDPPKTLGAMPLHHCRDGPCPEPATLCPAAASTQSCPHSIFKCMVLYVFLDQPEIKPLENIIPQP